MRGAMRRAGVVTVLVALMLLAGAACGGSTRKPLPSSARVIRRGDFRGYSPQTRHSFPTPNAYLGADSNVAASQSKAWIARRTREGFKTDLSEFLKGPQGPQTGVSGVMQLGSAAAVRAELSAELHSYGGQIAETFHVAAIPGAVGYGFRSAATGGENILFADGPFLYLVGYGWYGTAHNPKHAALINAATKLYTRVHGHPAG